MLISTQVHSNVSCKKFDNLMDFHGDGIIFCGDIDAGISDSGEIIVNDVRPTNCADKE